MEALGRFQPCRSAFTWVEAKAELWVQPLPKQPPGDLSPTHVNEPLLILLGHIRQLIVATSQVPLEALQSSDGHVLHFPSLRPGAGRRQAQPADAATSAHPRGQHIALVKLPVSDLPDEAERRVSKAATEHSLLTYSLPGNLQALHYREHHMTALCD